MTRRRLRLLALGALVVAVLVAMLLEPAWVARNTVSLVGVIAVMLWTIARDFVMGVVSAEDYDALTSWLFVAGRRDTYPVAQVVIVGLQGCSRADSRKLRDELRAARRALAADGVYVERTSWEAFADRLDEAPFVPEGEDDLFRLAVLGQLDRGREHIVTKVSELRQGGNEKAHALALVLEWMASGSTDDAEMERLAERLDPDDAWAGDFDSCWPWLLFARPNKRARRLLLRARQRWNENRRELASDGDGNLAEQVHLEGAAIELLATVVSAWEGSVSRAALSNAFRAYYDKTLGFYGLAGPISATWLEMKIAEEPLLPGEALARLRPLIDPPITPRPDRRAAAAPALRAVDAILEKLVLGMGRTVRQGHDGVRLVAKPGEVSRDFF
ncbi:hypothetical protein [Pyxidicoccus caerfyrddinensis]|uniref:hypothetical protein n=1 Tax=Pyxidicoccus caerfyrddinensis TaxID=2709663 RepID=UPI0013DBE371|nr:hypothetical protein [Pyxidicoccus caerfyrddinensis]